VEDGKIVNDLLGYGDGQDWEARPKFPGVDEESIITYGLRQASEYFSGVTNSQTVKANVKDRISKKKDSLKNIKLKAINIGDTFKYIDLGNIMSLRLQNMGFNTSEIGFEADVRIMAMTYNPDTKNKIDLVVEVK
jgi:hypothetical protein